MEHCHGQADVVSSRFSSKMKVVALRLGSIPKLSTHSVLPVPYICGWQNQCLLGAYLLHWEQLRKNNEKGNDLKEIYHSQWTDKNDAFEI
eukprot:bmy_17274T0